MKKNKVKELLKQGKVVIGAIVDSSDPRHIEIMGQIGYDFVLTDHEHTSRDLPQIEQMIYAADAAGLPCVVRIREPNGQLVGRIMDAGAMGILLAHTHTREEAVALCRGAKYPPFYPGGERGMSHTTRSHDFSAEYGPGFVKYLKLANEETMLFVLIEGEEGVKNADAIASVDGIDGIFFGKGDFSLETGIYGQPDHPKLVAATEKVRKAVRDHNKLLWMDVIDPTKTEAAVKFGSNIVMIAHDYTHFRVMYQGFFDIMKKAAGRTS